VKPTKCTKCGQEFCSDHLDIGALVVWRPDSVEIKLCVVAENGDPFTITVDKRNHVQLRNLATDTEIGAETEIGQRLIGYALRRAICRGIDTSECIHEERDVENSKTRVTINLGKFSLHRAGSQTGRTPPFPIK
jgi:hypothetical protein